MQQRLRLKIKRLRQKKPKEDESLQTKISKTEDKSTQTELSKDDIFKRKKDAKKHQEKLDKLNSEMKDKDKLSDKRKEKIKELEAQTALFPELR